MSLSQSHHIFAGIAQSGINTLLRALFTTRPHYLRYGSPQFIPASTVNATSVAAIAFPGLPAGIQYAVDFSIPEIDLFPPDAGSASPIPPGKNQFGLHTKVRVTLGCMTGQLNYDRVGKLTPIFAELEVWALGEIISHYYGPGTGYITFQVDDVRIPEIEPQKFEAILDCLIRMLLNGIFATIQLPFHALSAGAFNLILEAGPVIEDDQIKVWGSI